MPMDDDFKRVRLPDVKGAIVIRSTCVVCGERLTGDITDGLRAKELDHLEHCTKKNNTDSA